MSTCFPAVNLVPLPLVSIGSDLWLFRPLDKNAYEGSSITQYVIHSPIVPFLSGKEGRGRIGKNNLQVVAHDL